MYIELSGGTKNINTNKAQLQTSCLKEMFLPGRYGLACLAVTNYMYLVLPTWVLKQQLVRRNFSSGQLVHIWALFMLMLLAPPLDSMQVGKSFLMKCTSLHVSVRKSPMAYCVTFVLTLPGKFLTLRIIYGGKAKDQPSEVGSTFQLDFLFDVKS